MWIPPGNSSRGHFSFTPHCVAPISSAPKGHVDSPPRRVHTAGNG
jgi:hypothetical protein